MTTAPLRRDESVINDPNYHPEGQPSVDWHPESNLFREHVSRYVYASKLAAGARALDIACGKGYGTYYLAKQAKSAEGIDMNPASIDVAKAHFRVGNLSYRVGDALKVATSAKAFDLITAFEIIEHLPPGATDAFLAGVGRLLAPSGQVLISTPNHDVVVKSGAYVPDYHINNFTPVALRSKLLEHFEQVTMLGQFKARSGIEAVLFTLDIFNARHLLASRLKALRPPAAPSSPADHGPGLAQPVVDAAFFDRIYDSFGDFRFSRWHWRQAGLTLAIASGPRAKV